MRAASFSDSHPQDVFEFLSLFSVRRPNFPQKLVHIFSHLFHRRPRTLLVCQSNPVIIFSKVCFHQPADIIFPVGLVSLFDLLRSWLSLFSSSLSGGLRIFRCGIPPPRYSPETDRSFWYTCFSPVLSLIS